MSFGSVHWFLAEFRLRHAVTCICLFSSYYFIRWFGDGDSFGILFHYNVFVFFFFCCFLLFGERKYTKLFWDTFCLTAFLVLPDCRFWINVCYSIVCWKHTNTQTQIYTTEIHLRKCFRKLFVCEVMCWNKSIHTRTQTSSYTIMHAFSIRNTQCPQSEHPTYSIKNNWIERK